LVKQSHRHSASNDENEMLTKAIDGEEFIHDLMVVIRVAQLEEELEDTKGVIRIRNGQKKKDKSTNNAPQNIHIKLKIE
jgi:plasmid stability protein